MVAIVAHKLELSCRFIFSGGLFCAIHAPQTVRCVLSVATANESSHKTSEGNPVLGSGALGWHGKRARQRGNLANANFVRADTFENRRLDAVSERGFWTQGSPGINAEEDFVREIRNRR